MSSELDKLLLISIKGVLALVFLTSLIVMADPLPDTFFPFIVGKALYFRTLTEIALGLWLVLVFRYPSHLPPRSWLYIAFAVYVAIAFAAAMFGVSPQRSLWSTYERMQGVVDLAHWFAFTVVFTSIFRSWADWRWILHANLAVSIAMGFIGLGQQYGIKALPFLSDEQRVDITLGNPTYVGAYMLVNVLIAAGFLAYSYLEPREEARERPPPPRRGRRRRRPRSRPAQPKAVFPDIWWIAIWAVAIVSPALLLLVSGDILAYVALLFALLLFTLSYSFISQQRKTQWWRVLWSTAVLLDGLMIVLSGTRGALLGVVVGFLAVAVGYLLWGRVRTLRLVAWAVVTGLLSLVLVFALVRNTDAFRSLASSNVMLSRLATIGFGDESIKGRINSAKVGLDGFAKRPLLGWGPENFTIAYDRYVTAEIVAQQVISFDQAHNKLIEELTTKGIIGVLSYMALWVYAFWAFVRRAGRLSPHHLMFSLFAGAALLGYFVQNLFLFDTPGTVTQFFLLLCFVVYLDTSSDMLFATSGVEGTQVRSPNPGAAAAPLIRHDSLFAFASTGVAVLVLLAIIYVNVGPYIGATAVLKTLNPNISWTERLGHFEDSIDGFRPLANYPRIILFNQVNNNFARMSDSDKAAVLELVNKEGVRGINSEPEEWRLHLSLARLYQSASTFDDAYTERARTLVTEAAELAPERIEVYTVLVRQYIADGDYTGAKAMVDAYLERNARAESLFRPLIDQINSAIAQ